ncbi:MAG: type 1 glutamine amidotransferase [Bryobacteraceae bacterium]|nr:type 1 glutamine amidotransferase [Solibacteraceae bacterium]MCO5352626.1 type 1 glutamine amidotransferase [Bryobacteraceae bacterium]
MKNCATPRPLAPKSGKVRLRCIQHVSFEGPGAIADWAASRGVELRITRLDAGDPVPMAEDFDWLLLMGGPMSVHDEDAHTWLREEKALLCKCLGIGVPVLGICLGSQMLAECLGARVVKNPHREIGWHSIRVTAGCESRMATMPVEAMVFHWHGETHTLPPGATLLAHSEACEVQAFETVSAIGLQFHLEMASPGLEELIRNCGSEIGTGPYEQTPEVLRAGESAYGEAARRMLSRLLDSILARVAAARR